MCVFGCDAYHTPFFACHATKKQTQINIADLGYVFATGAKIKRQRRRVRPCVCVLPAQYWTQRFYHHQFCLNERPV